MALVDKVRRVLSKVEKTIKTFALLQRSTAMAFKGSKFAALFPEDASAAVRLGVWQAMVLHPRGTPCDLIVHAAYPGIEETFPLENDKITFYLSRAFVEDERKIFNLLQSGIVTLRETDTCRWLDDPAGTARDIAASVVEKSVYTSVVVLCPFSEEREAQIRTALKAALTSAGSGSPDEQASACSVIALDSLSLVTDLAPSHLIVDAAHRLGTSKHARWAAWALPLQHKGVLTTIELFAGAQLMGTEPGFSVTLNMPTSSVTDPFAVRAMAARLLQTRLPETHQLVRTEKKWPQTASQLLGAGTQFLIVARLIPSRERDANDKLIKSTLAHTVLVKHCALLGNNALAVGVAAATRRAGATVAVVLRSEVATLLNLRDWIAVLEAVVPGRTFLCIVAPETDRLPTVAEFIEMSRMPYDPRLTRVS